MVLLTYQSATPRCNGEGDKEPVENETDKSDGPKTAYIDKLYKFKDENAFEEKCDLFFICHDGEVPAHRLVISNASKYIMAMQNDQPPWYPVYISVPDLNTEIVQTLVQLAYTGQMNIPPSTTSDDLLDAMQALGWVHTDALTATYTDSANPLNDEDIGSPLNKSRESVESIIKLNFPSNPKPEADTSEDEGGMEIDVPDLPMSDEDDSRFENNDVKDTKKGAGRRANRRINKPAVTKKETPKANNVKQKKTVSESPKIEPPVTPAKSETRRRGRKNVEDETDGAKNSQVSTEAPSSAASSPEAVRSRTRTIRKPKKFEDSIVLTPTKRKDSPLKSPTKNSTNDSKSKAQSEELSNNLTPRRNAPNKALKPADKAKDSAPAAASTSRTRRSTSASSDSKDTPKNSLITSYFTKRSTRRSDDFTSSGNTDEPVVENHEKPTEKEKVQNSEVQETSRARRTASKDTKKTEEVTTEDSDNTTTLRKRAKSTASNKSEKDTAQEESKHAGSTETNKTHPRRKRNLQESSDSTAADETVNPTRRGRRTSTISTASSKEAAAEGNMEDLADNGVEESSRKKRNRPE